MGSSSKLIADAFTAMCNSLPLSTSWLSVQKNVSPYYLHFFVWFVLASTVLVIHKSTQYGERIRQIGDQGIDKLNVGSHDSYLGEGHIIFPVNPDFGPVDTPFLDLTQSVSNVSCTVEEQQLEKSSSNAWENISVNHEEVIPNSPLSSFSLSESSPPRLNRSISDSTQTDASMFIPSPLVHIFCTHVEQKISNKGIVSSVTRPSYHVPAAHFPQLQTTFAASSERAFFNTQQDLSVSPILRDPGYLDLQYRLSPPVNPESPGEVSFDEIIATIRRNRKAGRDTTIYVHVMRVKDTVPSVVLNYVYHGQRQRSVVSSITQFGDAVPECTRIVGFRTHLIRVKHLSADTLLWDCARHVVRSVKQDHGIILQTRELTVEIHSQDQGSGNTYPSKMDSSETIKVWIRDILPTLLRKNGNVVQLQVSAFKKA